MQQNAIKPIRNCRGEAKPRPLRATPLAGSQKMQGQSKGQAAVNLLWASGELGSKQTERQLE